VSEGHEGHKSGRRPLLIGLVGGTAALGAVTVAGRVSSWLGDDDSPEASGSLQLTTESSSMAAASVALTDLLALQTDGSRATPKLATSTHNMVGVTWQGDQTPRVRIRSRAGGRWAPWRRLTTMHDGPDDDSVERSSVRGTELVWTGDADGIQVHVVGDVPKGLTLTLLRPARLSGDAAAARTTTAAVTPLGRVSASAKKKAVDLEPPLKSRASWGADESLRSGNPQYNSTIQQAHVHHSASGNDYAQADVPALLRGFYRYHTKSLGWSDIGYNFLVDRFGGIWVGRAGGPGRPVRGAHTLGFNATSVGICTIGNYDSATPTSAMLSSVAAVAAWKLQKYGVDPNASVRVSSEGSDKFKAGKAVTLRTIDGHRDTNDTACPGQKVYDRLQTIRDLAAAKIAAASAPPVQVTSPAVLTGSPVLGSTLTVTTGSYTPAATTTVTWLRNGTPVPGATGTTYAVTTADLGATLGVQVTSASAGYTSAVENLSVAAVRATSKIKAKARTRKGVTTVDVSVRGKGVSALGTGTAIVRLGKRRREVPLVDGAGSASFPGMLAGRKPLLIKFPGDGMLVPARMKRTIKITRRG
jgi:hypothetical protein